MDVTDIEDVVESDTKASSPYFHQIALCSQVAANDTINNGKIGRQRICHHKRHRMKNKKIAINPTSKAIYYEPMAISLI